MPRWAVDAAVRRGELVTLFPRAYVRPWDLDDPFVRLAAGLASVGGDAALSHPSALTVWELLKPDAFRPVHVTTEDGRHTRGQQGDLVVHRKPSLPPTSVRGGLTVLRPEWAITDSWPMLQGYDKRAPAITAVRNRITTPDRIADAAPPNLPGRAALLDLLAMVADGCHSELEVWGYREVFNIPGLNHARRQRTIRVRDKPFYLDHAYEEERVAFELDGRAYHSGDEQRERDIKRDALVATIGWQTVRFSHFRLTRDIAGCRRDGLETLAARRRATG